VEQEEKGENGIRGSGRNIPAAEASTLLATKASSKYVNNIFAIKGNFNLMSCHCFQK
jgi:hypothetical protein